MTSQLWPVFPVCLDGILGENIAGFSLCGYPAFLHQDTMVAVAQHMVEIVQYGDDRVTALAAQGTGQCQYPVLLFEILC